MSNPIVFCILIGAIDESKEKQCSIKYDAMEYNS